MVPVKIDEILDTPFLGLTMDQKRSLMNYLVTHSILEPAIITLFSSNFQASPEQKIRFINFLLTFPNTYEIIKFVKQTNPSPTISSHAYFTSGQMEILANSIHPLTTPSSQHLTPSTSPDGVEHEH
ncbi:MAG: hypothetical protein FWC53_03850 [Firmicutes bacterium]|nr:hypothetical protein [Bacillota bacterium]